MSFSALKDVTKEDLLEAVGLSLKRSTTSRVLAATGFFAAGAVLGAVTALLLAPKSGKGLREDLGTRLGRTPNGSPDVSLDAAEAGA